MARALIVGAGAIGRGFLPWTFKDLEFDMYDNSTELCRGISNRNGYLSFMSRNGTLVEQRFSPVTCSSSISELDLKSYCVAFIAVGPRNCSKLPSELSELNCPIFSIENDPATVEIIADITRSNNIFFGVPDVITSSTASKENLDKDPFALHTEDGSLYLESTREVRNSLEQYLPNVIWSSKNEMIREWDAKLFLHNTPHCVAAYLGFFMGKRYLHETFQNDLAIRIIEGVIEEVMLALKRAKSHEHSFLEEYADKELKRFANTLLYDPISRVAREPLRKLAIDGRLMGGLTMSLLAGVNPVFLNLGIVASLNYVDANDADYSSMIQLERFGVQQFLKYFLNISTDSLEARYIVQSYDTAINYLTKNLI